MKNLMIHGLAVAGIFAMVGAQAPAALAEYKKIGPDKRSTAQMAENECEAQANGSRQVIIGTVLGGLIGQAIGRQNYVEDCMKERGYEKVKRQRKKASAKPVNKTAGKTVKKPAVKTNF
jgi:hypothetical protein